MSRCAEHDALEPCSACRSEQLAATEQAQLAAGIDDEQRAVNERGARRARAVLSNHTEED